MKTLQAGFLSDKQWNTERRSRHQNKKDASPKAVWRNTFHNRFPLFLKSAFTQKCSHDLLDNVPLNFGQKYSINFSQVYHKVLSYKAKVLLQVASYSAWLWFLLYYITTDFAAPIRLWGLFPKHTSNFIEGTILKSSRQKSIKPMSVGVRIPPITRFDLWICSVCIWLVA